MGSCHKVSPTIIECAFIFSNMILFFAIYISKSKPQILNEFWFWNYIIALQSTLLVTI